MNLKQKFILISKNDKIKILKLVKKNKGGRNNFGRITVRHRGAKILKKFRIIDNYKALWNIYAYIKKFEYDPNRNTLVMLLSYVNGIFSYIIAIETLNINNKIKNGIRIKKKNRLFFSIKIFKNWLKN